MTTQVKPVSGGSFQTVTKNSTGTVADSSANISTLPTSGTMHAALRAANVWVNCAGQGTHATRAQKIAHAAGVLLQEI